MRFENFHQCHRKEIFRVRYFPLNCSFLVPLGHYKILPYPYSVDDIIYPLLPLCCWRSIVCLTSCDVMMFKCRQLVFGRKVFFFSFLIPPKNNKNAGNFHSLNFCSGNNRNIPHIHNNRKKSPRGMKGDLAGIMNSTSQPSVIYPFYELALTFLW